MATLMTRVNGHVIRSAQGSDFQTVILIDDVITYASDRPADIAMCFEWACMDAMFGFDDQLVSDVICQMGPGDDIRLIDMSLTFRL